MTKTMAGFQAFLSFPQSHFALLVSSQSPPNLLNAMQAIKPNNILVDSDTAGKSAHTILIVKASDKIRDTSLSLEFLTEDGKVLSTTSVSPVGKSGAHFSASFSTPTVPFRLKLRGKTKKNYDFERSSRSIVHPSHALVRVLYARHEFTVPIRGRELVIFFVYNSAATEIFDLKVKDSSKFNALVLSSAVRVYKDRSGFFFVYFSAKSTATSGAADNVIVTATGRTSKVSVNHVFSLMVV